MSAVEMLQNGQSVEQVASTARVTRQTVGGWIARGLRLSDGSVVRLEASRIAGRWRIPPGALERFLTATNESVAGPSEVR